MPTTLLPADVAELDDDALETARRQAHGTIDRAYWAFTRQARAKPPVLVCPEAYALRRACEKEQERRRTIERGVAPGKKIGESHGRQGQEGTDEGTADVGRNG